MKYLNRFLINNKIKIEAIKLGIMKPTLLETLFFYTIALLRVKNLFNLLKIAELYKKYF